MKFTEARAKYKAVEPFITFEQAKEISVKFDELLAAPGKILRNAPKHPNGLTKDEAKNPEWRAAYYQYEKIRTEQRGFAEMYARKFKKELRNESYARRNVKTVA